MPSVLCIAGLDPSSYSGLSADMRALNSIGVRFLQIATVLTAQNATCLSDLHHVPGDIIKKQLDAIFISKTPDAVKIGVIGSPEIAKIVAEYLSDKSIPVVTDPVFMSSSGFEFADDELIEVYRQVLIPISTVLTPNALEACRISGQRIENIGDAEAACRRIFELGPGAVLLKGGHIDGSKGTDTYFDENGPCQIKTDELDVRARGTGCVYSSLIAGYLSLGMDRLEAVRKAKIDMHRALSSAALEDAQAMLFESPASPIGGASQQMLNLKYSESLEKAINRAELRIANIEMLNRAHALPSSKNFHTEKIISTLGFAPDVLFENGSSGKEPTLWLLASTPTELIKKLKRILECTE